MLIGAYVACQAAALPHAHGDGDIAHGRGERHFHLPKPSHCHSDHDGHHHHDHDLQTCVHVPVVPAELPSEHDSDAVYIPDVVLIRTDSSNVGDDFLWEVFAEVASFASAVGLVADLATGFEMPDRVCASVGHCALYLKLRTLRI
ncbi:MAG: hypothetical protein JNM18_00935 [Planctomycetaceae bacterium]|nr:hypothetical protein [Planctomycetaceae bacterium]